MKSCKIDIVGRYSTPLDFRTFPWCLYETSRTPQTGHITNMTEPWVVPGMHGLVVT